MGVYNNSRPGGIQSEWPLAAFAPFRIMLKRAFILLALLSLALAANAAAQSVVPDSTPTIGPAKPDLFIRIIANQKRGEAALDLYERIERIETRKNSGDPTPAATKIARVIPSGTGMFRIPVGDDGKPGIPPRIAPISRNWRGRWRCWSTTPDFSATRSKNTQRKGRTVSI